MIPVSSFSKALKLNDVPNNFFVALDLAKKTSTARWRASGYFFCTRDRTVVGFNLFQMHRIESGQRQIPTLLDSLFAMQQTLSLTKEILDCCCCCSFPCPMDDGLKTIFTFAWLLGAMVTVSCSPLTEKLLLFDDVVWKVICSSSGFSIVISCVAFLQKGEEKQPNETVVSKGVHWPSERCGHRFQFDFTWISAD